MFNEELRVYKVTYAAEYMDMSGGDSVDGPRWTGSYVKHSNTVLVVAPTKDFAEAYVVSVCGERDDSTKIVDIEDLGKCAGIVDLIGPNGRRPSIVRPFAVETRTEK